MCVEMPQTVFHNSPSHVSCCCSIVLSRAAVGEHVIKQLHISYQHLVKISGFVLDKAAITLWSACDMSSSESLMLVEASTSRRGA
jgi:hypothetical protein